ncbi:hypothetical protein NCCP2145_01600 [Pseudarthrobacter sp. NCCP-2145]|nr:hypothetical protein GCM10017547_40560 [Pseudarthrobacter oxydans]GKV70779.1 hypothetical protein NCCP2145_01600 [Pseudarthrobacter sp. NCCP-2145]
MANAYLIMRWRMSSEWAPAASVMLWTSESPENRPGSPGADCPAWFSRVTVVYHAPKACLNSLTIGSGAQTRAGAGAKIEVSQITPTYSGPRAPQIPEPLHD